MALSLGGGKNKSSSTSNQSFNQTSRTSMGDSGKGLLESRLSELGDNRYRGLEIGDVNQWMSPYGASRLTGGQFREGGRQYEAAALEWADAMLRLTSGAQAPETEVRQQMKAYFPQPGDSEAVRRQKAEMRREAEIAAAQRAGPGYRQGGSPSGQPVRVNSVAEARALPSGTVFIDPNGVCGGECLERMGCLSGRRRAASERPARTSSCGGQAPGSAGAVCRRQ